MSSRSSEHGRASTGSARLSAGARAARACPLGGRARRMALRAVLAAQAESYDPDVVYLQDMGYHSTAEVRALKAAGAGSSWVRSRARRRRRATSARFDLIVTSFPHFAERFRPPRHRQRVSAAGLRRTPA